LIVRNVKKLIGHLPTKSNQSIIEMVLYGQLVIGPPSAGKTTFCYGMSMFLREIDRNCDIVNLDFANENIPYTASIDVRDLISLETAMSDAILGPNGGLVYCMEYLLEHLDWLVDRLQALDSDYVIFDCPGQVCMYIIV
jgi:GTPase SAR1 family protein